MCAGILKGRGVVYLCVPVHFSTVFVCIKMPASEEKAGARGKVRQSAGARCEGRRDCVAVFVRACMCVCVCMCV